MHWCASGLSEPSDIALATNRLQRLSADSTSSSIDRRPSRTDRQQIAQHRRLPRQQISGKDLERCRRIRRQPAPRACFPPPSAAPSPSAAARHAAPRHPPCGSAPSRSPAARAAAARLLRHPAQRAAAGPAPQSRCPKAAQAYPESTAPPRSYAAPGCRTGARRGSCPPPRCPSSTSPSPAPRRTPSASSSRPPRDPLSPRRRAVSSASHGHTAPAP